MARPAEPPPRYHLSGQLGPTPALVVLGPKLGGSVISYIAGRGSVYVDSTRYIFTIGIALGLAVGSERGCKEQAAVCLLLAEARILKTGLPKSPAKLGSQASCLPLRNLREFVRLIFREDVVGEYSGAPQQGA